MPNSLKSRLKKLEHQGLLSEKELSRIVVIPDNATNGDMIKALFDCKIVEETPSTYVFEIEKDWFVKEFEKEWWNAPYKKGDKDEI